jgi:two-component system response regulator MtrA
MCQKARILVIDDEPPIGDIVSSALSRRGHEVIYAESGQKGIDIFDRQAIDLVILDIMMPDMDGFTVCDLLRTQSTVPIVMLTAKGNVNDIVHGFRLGADDYITKPFSVKELDARVESILRRVAWFDDQTPKTAITIRDIAIDAEARTVAVHGDPVHLTPMEFELLYYLMSHAGEAIPKHTLFREVWGYDATDGSNLVEVGVRRLRAKVEQDSSAPVYILTVRGVGYKFAAKEDLESA